ncbi:MAG: hypothetical protein V4588_02495, partial [Pseudomonadota bacterium]
DGNDTIDGGAGADNLTGGIGNDSIIGGAGNDTIDGGADNDFIDARLGKDIVFGGTGNDTILGSVNVAGGPTFADRFTSIESGAGTDTLVLSGFINNQVYSTSTLATLVTNTEILSIKGDATSTAFHVDSASILSITGVVGSTANPALTVLGDLGADTFTIDLSSGQTTSVLAGSGNDITYGIYSSTSVLQATVHWQAT